MLPVSLVPSLPAASFETLANLLRQLRGVVKAFQVDIVDGIFVPHTFWPFTEADPQRALASLAPFTTDFSLELDCMVREPLQYLDTIAALPAKRVIVHVGSTHDYGAIVAHAQTHHYRLGIAATADVPLAELTALIPQFDYVQLMGIAKVGSQGQPFDTRILPYARALRTTFPELEIAVDGAVNADTIPQLYAAGVNRFAPGSAIAKADDPVAAYRELAQLVGIA